MAEILEEAEGEGGGRGRGTRYDVERAERAAASLLRSAMEQIDDTRLADTLDDEAAWDAEAMAADHALRPAITIDAFVNARKNLQVVLGPGPRAGGRRRRVHWRRFPSDSADGWGRPPAEVLWMRDLDDLLHEPGHDPVHQAAVMARLKLREEVPGWVDEIRCIAGDTVVAAFDELAHRLSRRFTLEVLRRPVFKRETFENGNRREGRSLMCLAAHEIRRIEEADAREAVAFEATRRAEEERRQAALVEARRVERIAAVVGDPVAVIAEARRIAQTPRSGRLVKDYLDSVGVPTRRGEHHEALARLEADLRAGPA